MARAEEICEPKSCQLITILKSVRISGAVNPCSRTLLDCHPPFMPCRELLPIRPSADAFALAGIDDLQSHPQSPAVSRSLVSPTVGECYAYLRHSFFSCLIMFGQPIVQSRQALLHR